MVHKSVATTQERGDISIFIAHDVILTTNKASNAQIIVSEFIIRYCSPVYRTKCLYHPFPGVLFVK